MLTVTMSIFANTVGGNLTGLLVSLGHNLFSDTPGVPLDPTDLVNTNPLLAALGNYGGPTETMALLPGSPAIDAGVSVPGVTTDQRGVPRPQGSAPDIGAFESRGFTLAVVGGSGQSAHGGSPFAAPLVVSVSSRFGEPVAGGLVTFSAPAKGASATLSGNPATIGANGQASVTAVANAAAGAYTITAGAAGAGNVGFQLTNAGRADEDGSWPLPRTRRSPASPVTFIAVVSGAASGSGTPTGLVTFSVDGVAQAPVPLTMMNGQAVAFFTTTSLGLGSHTVTAAYDGGTGFAASPSNAVTQVVNPPPAVVLLQRIGTGYQPTHLVLTFNLTMNAATAQRTSATTFSHPIRAPRLRRAQPAADSGSFRPCTIRPS